METSAVFEAALDSVEEPKKRRSQWCCKNGENDDKRLSFTITSCKRVEEIPA